MKDHTSYDPQTEKRLRFLSWLFRLCVIVALISALTWGWSMFKDPQFLPIKTVKIIAPYQHVTKKSLESVVMPYVPAGLLSVNADGLQQQLLQIPWVYSASIKRVWPNQLTITITEQQPVAIWNVTSLLNAAGDIFSPPPATFPAGLPLLDGPDGQQALVLQQYQQFGAQLAPFHLTIAHLSLDQRRSWQMVLNNGVVLVLGKEDPTARFNRFIAVYNKVFSNPQQAALRVDMRYSDGFAVQWQNVPENTVNNTGTQPVPAPKNSP